MLFTILIFLSLGFAIIFAIVKTDTDKQQKVCIRLSIISFLIFLALIAYINLKPAEYVTLTVARINSNTTSNACDILSDKDYYSDVYRFGNVKTGDKITLEKRTFIPGWIVIKINEISTTN
ncbi:MAG: hypothetical protein WC725_05210 [Patescibacteria group bacterium]|jgi:hypothetical protein